MISMAVDSDVIGGGGGCDDIGVDCGIDNGGGGGCDDIDSDCRDNDDGDNNVVGADNVGQDGGMGTYGCGGDSPLWQYSDDNDKYVLTNVKDTIQEKREEGRNTYSRIFLKK